MDDDTKFLLKDVALPAFGMYLASKLNNERLATVRDIKKAEQRMKEVEQGAAIHKLITRSMIHMLRELKNEKEWPEENRNKAQGAILKAWRATQETLERTDEQMWAAIGEDFLKAMNAIIEAMRPIR